MKNIMKKLRSRRGESLVEVLCAILIFTMSSVAMYSMVMAANNINAAAKKADEAHQQAMLIVEKGETGASEGFITVSIPNAAGTEKARVVIPVDVFEAEDLYSYFKAETGGTS